MEIIFSDLFSRSCVWIVNNEDEFPYHVEHGPQSTIHFYQAGVHVSLQQRAAARGKANRQRCENVYLIFLCPLVQSPCSIPLITVSTVSTSHPEPIHPQSNRNLLIHRCDICMEPWTKVNILPQKLPT